MKVKMEDLRIGNSMHGNFLHRKEVITVKGVHLNGFYYDGLNAHGQMHETTCHKDRLKPVKLNKVQLMKLGFKYIKDITSYSNKIHLIYENDNNSFCFCPFSTSDSDCYIEINYVHEVQNLILDLKK